MRESREGWAGVCCKQLKKYLWETHVAHCSIVLVLSLQCVIKGLESCHPWRVAVAGCIGNACSSQTKVETCDLTQEFSCILNFICPQKPLQFHSFMALWQGQGQVETCWTEASLGHPLPLISQRCGQLLGKCPGAKISTRQERGLGLGIQLALEVSVNHYS